MAIEPSGYLYRIRFPHSDTSVSSGSTRRSRQRWVGGSAGGSAIDANASHTALCTPLGSTIRWQFSSSQPAGYGDASLLHLYHFEPSGIVRVNRHPEEILSGETRLYCCSLAFCPSEPCAST